MKVLLVYFSGCGYTFWTAQKLATLLKAQGHTVSGVLDIEKYAPAEQERSERHIFLTPTYFFAPPALFVKALHKIPMVADKEAVVIATKGGQQGLTTVYTRSLLTSRGYKVIGTADLTLPDTFIGLKSSQLTSAQRVARLKKAEDELKALCKKIVGTEPFSCDRSRAYSFIALPFLWVFRHAFGLSFISTDACTHCGLCEKNCPMHCIHLKDGRPVWKHNCTACFRCVNACPAHAIDMSAVSWILGACGAVIGWIFVRWFFGWLGAFLSAFVGLVGLAYGCVAGVAVGQKIYRKVAQTPLFANRNRIACENIKKG
ncbi:MAG: EFR1 family ferrodoxin [Alphaproteobacteria bacterium]|nr:EFR1 family ferrodoxin [Alphaproteobacteria bacterium]